MGTPLQNKLQGHAVTLDIGANGNYALSDFATTDYAGNTENVQSLSITNIIWTGQWNIYRGSNLVFSTDTTHGDFDLASHGISIGKFGNATLNTVATSSNSTLILKLAKQAIALNPQA